MDWVDQPDATKDFSLVIWRTGNKPVIIVEETIYKQSDWQREEKRTNDNNAVMPSGADNCEDNPLITAFEDFYATSKFPAFVVAENDASPCKWGPMNWETTGFSGGPLDLFWIVRGGCKASLPTFSMPVIITMPSTFWDAALISEGAVEHSSEQTSNGMIAKTFVLGGAGGSDRVAIYSPGSSGVVGEDVQIQGWQFVCNTACNADRPSWNVYPSLGVD